MGSPIALLNVGPTRADDLATLKIDGRSGEVSSFSLTIEVIIDASLHLFASGLISWLFMFRCCHVSLTWAP